MDREINSDVCLLKVEDVKSVVISGLRNLVLIDKKPTLFFASFFLDFVNATSISICSQIMLLSILRLMYGK